MLKKSGGTSFEKLSKKSEERHQVITHLTDNEVAHHLNASSIK